MIREKNINWYLSDPTRLIQMKPFTRGGSMNAHGYEESTILNNSTINTGFANLSLKPISQDKFITEYYPDLHHIKWNSTIPHIKVILNGQEMPSDWFELTEVAAFQKLIHSAHCRSLTGNPLEFNLCSKDLDKGGKKTFDYAKSEWAYRNMDYWFSRAVNACKMLGNCGILFRYDKEVGQLDVTSYSYEDGYQIVPNYDEYGFEISRSLVYQIDDNIVIDTYDSTNHYRCTQGKNGWEIQSELHGFSRCPLLHKRGKVAWEYAESSIEMWELLKNIVAITSKRFGTFALAFWGEMDSETFKKDNSTLIINMASDQTNGKQDVKTLEYPESKNIDNAIASLERDISLFSSTSFITPKDISTTNSGGNGIALAMSNDYALATQTAMDWRKFVNDMFYLFQEGLDLETNGTEKYAQLKVSAKIIPWSLETNNTKITNLQMESKWLSMRTILERSPDSAPDEEERVIEERGSLIPLEGISDADSEKAARISKNRSNEIIDNQS